MVHLLHPASIHAPFLSLVAIHPLTAATLETALLVQFLWQRSAVVDMWLSETYHAGQRISDVTNYAARPGNVGGMHVQELVTLHLVILLADLVFLV